MIQVFRKFFRRYPDVLKIFGLAVTYYVAGKLSLLLAIPPG
jgi:hypothetical protein